MDSIPFSKRVQAMLAEAGPVIRYITNPLLEKGRRDPQACDFLVGNPQELPLPGITEALQKAAVPQNKNWFAYKMSERRSEEIIAASLRQSHHLPFEHSDVLMTTGAFSALSAALGTIIDPGDEIIYISPPWFFYTMMIVSYQGQPVRVPCDLNTFDLDLEAIQRAITPRTRGIIVNSPNNPTGRIYPPETLRRLAGILSEASRASGRTIYLLSDEAYNHIIYDSREYPSPVAFYNHSFLIYTYGKTLLAPGQRLGYIALPPSMPEKDILRLALTSSLVSAGHNFPNALMQHALADLEKLSIDVGHLQAKRDRLVGELQKMGYQLRSPEGTFYLLVRSPLDDEMAFTQMLAEQKIFCLPGTMFELPGYFRISLTASDEMIDRALPGFERALQVSRSVSSAETASDRVSFVEK